MNTTKQILTLALCGTILMASTFYLVLCAGGDGSLSIAEPDQLIYLQYASNLAQGQPYVYTPGDSPSTGSTSHLFPFVLALFYKLFGGGARFILTVFVLNTVFLFGMAVCVWLIARKLYPPIASLALFMSLISGHTLSAVFGQTDMGFFSLLALGLFASMLYGKNGITLILAILCAITRPEGGIFSIAFLMTGVSGLLLQRMRPDMLGTPSQSRWFILFGMAGLLAFCSTFIINHMLTGCAQFMSVSSKGYFKSYPFPGAIELSLYDLMAILKGFFLGLPENIRQFYHVPVLAGLLGIGGILLLPRTDKPLRLCESWLLLSVTGVLLTIASSQWQGLSHDRYLAWVFPLWTLYILAGAFELHARIGVRFFLPAILGLIIGFQALSLTTTITTKYDVAVRTYQRKLFATQIHEHLPPDARIGAYGGSNLIYYIPQRKIHNFSGITAPDFFDANSGPQVIDLIDRLKHRPELRFDYWLIESDFTLKESWSKKLIGDPAMIDTDTAISDADGQALMLCPAQWEILKGGEKPVLALEQLDELKLIDQLDVGYCAHEKSHEYKTHLRLRNLTIPLCFKQAKLGTEDYLEAGRIIIGSESFNIHNAVPNHPIRMVLRTSASANGICFTGRKRMKINNLNMNESLNLRVLVDGIEVECPTVQVLGDEFQEVILDIPKEYINTKSPHVEVAGDHISFSYWFYQ